MAGNLNPGLDLFLFTKESSVALYSKTVFGVKAEKLARLKCKYSTDASILIV